MKMTYVYILLVIVLVGGIVFAKNNSTGRVDDPTTYSDLDNFALCLADAGALFYGAFWCPHCQEQKKMFNNSRQLPYIECSTPDGKGTTPICVEKEITGFPTWILSDGTRLNGVQQLSDLGDATGCEVPTS